MDKTNLELNIEFPFSLSFSERAKVRKAAVDSAFSELESIYEEHRKRVFEEMSEIVMNRFDLKPSEAKLITECVLGMSGTYNHIINKLYHIREARCGENV